MTNRNSGSSPKIFRERFYKTSTYKNLSLIANYLISYYKGRQNHPIFQEIKTYCLFIGHARSGHSIVGALLDAHPNALIADEADALRYFAAGFSWDQVCYLLLSRSRRILVRKKRQRKGREGKIYSYFVPNQWQGRFDKLHVIGDTKAGRSTTRIGKDPAILQRLQDALPNANLRILHVVRNPYDNIATISIRGGKSVERACSQYFRHCEIIKDLRNRIDINILFVIRHEDIIDQPEISLSEMCRFLGLEVPPDYLSACASILFKSPSKSRHKIQWSSELIDSVQSKINEFDFLEGYSYDS